MSFTQEYQKKLTTADEAVKVVKSGDRLEYGWCVTTPVALDEALAKRMPDLENIQIHGGIVMSFSSTTFPSDNTSFFGLKILSYIPIRLPPPHPVSFRHRSCLTHPLSHPRKVRHRRYFRRGYR